jgi:hypothetical protein
MIAKRIGVALVAATLLASAGYVFVYLSRWEWNRATIAGIFMLGSELLLIAIGLAGRIRAVERKLLLMATPVDNRQQDRVLRRLREEQPARRDHFGWLRPTGTGTSVFVPVLMGAGLILSALAWAVERVARATARPGFERGLATQLAVFAVPAEPLVVEDAADGSARLGPHAILLRPDARESS